MQCLKLAILVACVSLSFVPQMATAQLEGRGAGQISAAGVATLKQQPDFLRMQVQLSANGKTLKEALAKLEENRTAALKTLKTLGASEKSVKWEGPEPSVVSPEQAQMMAMVMRQRGQRNRKVGSDKPASVAVTYTLTADWPLTAETPADLLIEADALQTKIKAANIAQQGSAELTPEEEELAEEMQEMMENYGREASKPGEPRFVFGKKLDQAEVNKAMADAYAMAKSNAELLAAAAGMKLGPLQQLASHRQQQFDMEEYFGHMSPYQRYYQNQAGSESDHEALAQSPGQVQLILNVQASFGLSK